MPINSQIKPQSNQTVKTPPKGVPERVREGGVSGGGTYDQSAGPMSADANARKPGTRPATEAKKVGKPGATYSGPESVKAKKAPSTGDRGIA